MRLAETYIHVKTSEAIRFDVLARTLEEGAVELARGIFVSGVQIEYLLEEGTLLERAKVIGKPLAVIVGVIAGYHELRESIIDIYNDARKFSEFAIVEFHKITHTDPSDVIYKRTIPTDVNRLYRITQNVDRISGQSVSERERRAAEKEIIRDIAGFHWSNPQDKGVQILLNNLPRRRLPEVPKDIKAILVIDERRRREAALHAPSGAGLARELPTRPRKRRYEKTTTI